MQLYISWYLLLPAVLAVFYGYTQYCAVSAMGAAARQAGINWLLAALSGLVLSVSWSALGYALPIFYVLTYLFRAARLSGRGRGAKMNWFLLNLSYINSMSVHLALVGAAALLTGSTMHTLLTSGFWRTTCAAAALAVDLIEDLIFLCKPRLAAAIAAESESVEVRPFMAFLWFCAGYLLVDSFLCVAELEPLYPPLFLIGSNAVLMYLLIRFLVHINALIRDEYLKTEHDRLSARLEAAQESAGTLRRLVDRDALTGALSRRRLMEHVDALIGAGAPFCLAYLDLDGLKRLNDSEGHDAGDRYLIGFAREMQARLGEGDLLARVGGDEFVVLLNGIRSDAAERRIRDIRGALEAEREDGGGFRFSYGVAEFLPGGRGDAEMLLSAADRVMYRDKAQRR